MGSCHGLYVIIYAIKGLMDSKNTIEKLFIAGFGNQGLSWAQNLIDSGLEIAFLVRELKPTYPTDKFNFLLAQEFLSSQKSPINLALLIPDNQHYDFLSKYSVPKNSMIILAHGYSVGIDKLDEKFSDLEFELLAPKAIATSLRENFLQAKSIGAGILKSSPNQSKIIELGKNLGITNFAMTSFEEETFCDLFSEQTLLCTELITSIDRTFSYLIDQGVNPELAYMESFQEAKFILDTLYEIGPKDFYEKISPHALGGAYKQLKSRNHSLYPDYFEKTWCDITSGAFSEWFGQAEIPKIRKEFKDNWENSKLEKMFRKFLDEKKYNQQKN